MQNVLRRPPKRAPQLLVLPDRQRVESVLRHSCGAPVTIVALELERNETQAHGDVLELVTVVMFPAPDHRKRLTLRHVMPGGAPDIRQLIGGAEAAGQAIRMRFRRYGGPWNTVVSAVDLF